MDSENENDRESDEALLQKVADGDERSFSELYDRFSEPLFGLMRQMLDDAHEAED
jgi:DNA-directed RNA polymerase specialized sigma24 family protein